MTNDGSSSEPGGTIKRPRDRVVPISRYQTAKLWIVPKREDPNPRVVSFHCSACRDSANSRLRIVELETEESELEAGFEPQRKTPAARVLLRVTRKQIDEIQASFGRQDNGETLRDILVYKGDPEERA